MTRLMDAGALDAFVTPIQMKKNRPGVMVSVLCDEAKIPALEDVLFRETTTLGIRRYPVSRHKLKRQAIEVETPFGPVRGKLGWLDDRPPTFSPEYDDCARIAAAQSVPLREVYDAAQLAYSLESKKPSECSGNPRRDNPMNIGNLVRLDRRRGVPASGDRRLAAGLGRAPSSEVATGKADGKALERADRRAAPARGPARAGRRGRPIRRAASTSIASSENGSNGRALPNRPFLSSWRRSPEPRIEPQRGRPVPDLRPESGGRSPTTARHRRARSASVMPRSGHSRTRGPRPR